MNVPELFAPKALKLAVACGLITQEQIDEIAASVPNAQPLELLQFLVERKLVLEEEIKTLMRLMTSRSESTSQVFQTIGTFGRYELLEILGRGGMGTVYKARDRELDRIVALKVLSSTESTPEQAARLHREATASARLRHPNIVAIYDVGVHEGRHYFTMEYIEGRSFQQWLVGHPGVIRYDRGVEILRDVARALDYAHGAGIIHRDITPTNIIVDREGCPYLTDFGLAKDVSALPNPSAGTVVGTPVYMSPEQAQGRLNEIGPATDVYSVGIILYELLSGRSPFDGANTFDIINRVTHEDPDPPRMVNPRAPRDLETICLKAIQKDPSKRYVTARELAEELDRYLKGQPIQAIPPGRLSPFLHSFRRNLHRFPIPMIAAILLALFLFHLPQRSNGSLDSSALDRTVKILRLLSEARGYLAEADRRLTMPGTRSLEEIRHSIRRATAKARDVLELDPRSAEACLCLSQALFLSGAAPEEVTESFDRAIEQNPQETQSRRSRGRFYLRRLFLGWNREPPPRTVELTRARENARTDFVTVSKTDPSLSESSKLILEASIALTEDRAQEALECCRRALSFRTAEDEIYELMAYAYAALSRWSDAIAALDECLQRWRPLFPEAVLLRGYLNGRMHRWEEATQDFLRAVEMNPADGEGHAALASLLERNQKFSEALQHYAKAVELHPRNPFFLSQCAALKTTLGDLQGAIHDASESLDLLGKDGEILHLRGNAHFLAGHFTEAAADYEAAVTLRPDLEKEIAPKLSEARSKAHGNNH